LQCSINTYAEQKSANFNNNPKGVKMFKSIFNFFRNVFDGVVEARTTMAREKLKYRGWE